MIDGIYLVAPSRCSGCAPCFAHSWKGCEPMMDIIVGILLIGYLFVSVIRPEKF